MRILAGERFNLAGEALTACIQVTPVASQRLDDTRHGGRQDISSRRQNARKFGAAGRIRPDHPPAGTAISRRV